MNAAVQCNEPDQNRMAKREFIARVAERSGWPLATVSSVYEAIFGELTDVLYEGRSVVLTGFGRFYPQVHKGHKVQFGQREVDPYRIVKFSASRRVNRLLDTDDDQEPAA